MPNPNRKYHTADEVDKHLKKQGQNETVTHFHKIQVGHLDHLNHYLNTDYKDMFALPILEHGHDHIYPHYIDSKHGDALSHIAKKAPPHIANKLNKLLPSSITSILAKRNIGRSEFLDNIKKGKYSAYQTTDILDRFAPHSDKDQLDQLYKLGEKYFNKPSFYSPYRIAKRASELNHKPLLDKMMKGNTKESVARFTPFREHHQKLIKDPQNWGSLLANKHLNGDHIDHIIKNSAPSLFHDQRSFTSNVIDKLKNHPDPTVNHLANNPEHIWVYDSDED